MESAPPTAITPQSDSKPEAATSAVALPVFRPYAALLVVVAILAGVLYWPVLRELVFEWWENPDYTHGFLVPVFAGFVVWATRNRYKTIPLLPSNFGLMFMFAAIVLLLLGTLAADEFSTRISICVLLAGMVVYLCGWTMLRALAFPLWYLTLAIPLPGIIYGQITFPLQLLASRIGARLIELTGVPVFREGNLFPVPNYSVEVAQACSGIRSLLTLMALAVRYAYFADSRRWLRILLLLLMIPLAVFTHALRIMVSCLVGNRFGAEYAEGFLHAFSGWLIYLVALALMFLTHWAIRRIGRLKSARPANG